MTSDTPTPPAMTPEQRAELVKDTKIKSAMIHLGEAIQWGSECALMDQCADQLEADGVTIATLTAECDAAQTELSSKDDIIARLNAKVAAAYEEAARHAQAHIANWLKGVNEARVNKNPKEARDWQSMVLAGATLRDAIRALATQPEADALAAALATARVDGMREARDVAYQHAQDCLDDGRFHAEGHCLEVAAEIEAAIAKGATT